LPFWLLTGRIAVLAARQALTRSSGNGNRSGSDR
jgi:hypothetical protein